MLIVPPCVGGQGSDIISDMNVKSDLQKRNIRDVAELGLPVNQIMQYTEGMIS